jgi:pimeloyl-ACP methyl ester carboxylesterase
MLVQSNGLQIKIQVDGNSSDPAILLIAGVGQQLIDWPDKFIEELVASGFYVIRFDNRDVGYSQNLKDLGVPNLQVQFVKSIIGLGVNSPYTLKDMAADAKGVLDALGIEKAHILGWSMGGMIVQRFALAYPDATLSMTCIMTASGVSKTRSDVINMMRKGPKDKTMEAKLDYFFNLYQLIQSPAYPEDPKKMRARILRSLERTQEANASSSGTYRQMLAIMQDAGRPHEIHQIKAPTLVLHGTADPMVDIAGGKDIAKRVPQAKLIPFEGMGHDFPDELIPVMVKEVKQIAKV